MLTWQSPINYGRLVRLRKMDKNTRQEMEALLDTYKAALGLEE